MIDWDYERSRCWRNKERLVCPPIELPEPDEIDRLQALRLPVLHEFFTHRTLPELLMDLSWLAQYLVFRQHQAELARRRETDAAPT